MQQVWLALLIGLIIGWLIEWLIDWRYWRRNLEALRLENAALRRQVAEFAASSPPAAVTPIPGAAAGAAETTPMPPVE